MIVARQPVRLLFLAAGLMCFASAPVRSEESTNQVKSATDLAREKARQQRQNLPFTKGTLRDIDFLRHELRLATVDGVRTFTYTPQTYIFRDKDKVAVDNLKIGEIIALRFNTDNDGNSTVVRIKAYGPPTTDGPPPGPAISTNQLNNTPQ
jgi:Cu/Ag efflux protein CusF